MDVKVSLAIEDDVERRDAKSSLGRDHNVQTSVTDSPTKGTPR